MLQKNSETLISEAPFFIKRKFQPLKAAFNPSSAGFLNPSLQV
jgi:hypothetical protein